MPILYNLTKQVKVQTKKVRPVAAAPVWPLGVTEGCVAKTVKQRAINPIQQENVRQDSRGEKRAKQRAPEDSRNSAP